MTFPSDTIPAEGLVDTEALRRDFDLPEEASSADEAEALLAMNRYLAALGHLEREIGANDEEHLQLMRYYSDRHAARQHQLGGRCDYLRSVLQRFFEAFPPTGKAKSRKLLAGTVGTRRKPARVTVVDETAVLVWAKAHAPDIVETKERVPAKAVQEHPDAAGVELVPAQDTFFATPGV